MSNILKGIKIALQFVILLYAGLLTMAHLLLVLAGVPRSEAATNKTNNVLLYLAALYVCTLCVIYFFKKPDKSHEQR